jgi:hypothetical protein
MSFSIVQIIPDKRLLLHFLYVVITTIESSFLITQTKMHALTHV